MINHERIYDLVTKLDAIYHAPVLIVKESNYGATVDKRSSYCLITQQSVDLFEYQGIRKFVIRYDLSERTWTVNGKPAPIGIELTFSERFEAIINALKENRATLQVVKSVQK